MADLRNLVFDALSEAKTGENPDLERMKVIWEGATVAVNVIKVQVAYASIVAGDLELPFMAEPVTAPEASKATVSPLTAGPSVDHPWRTGRIQHRLGR